MPENWVRAAKVKDIPEGTAIVFSPEGKTIALFKSGGEFYAIDNTCPHRGGPLAEGSLEGSHVTCPWHAWTFDITTGVCITAPGVNQRSYPVKKENDDIFVQV